MILLPGAEDEAIWRYFASLAFPPQDQVRATLDALAAAGRPLSTQTLETRVNLRRNRLELMLKVLDVDGAVRRVRGGWVATGQEWRYDAERYARVAAQRQAEQRAMKEYADTARCRMEYLRRQLDDPWAKPCGRCDNCAGPRYSPEVSPAALAAASAALGRPGVEIEPRRMWPTGMAALGVPLSGRIRPEEQAAAGRALGRLSDIGWGNRLRQLLAPGAPDSPVPDEVFDAVVQVLASWGWQRRPGAVAAIPSRTRPRLVTSLARRLAHVGRLPYLGELRRVGSAPPGANSAQRLRAVYDAFAPPPGLADHLPGLAGAPVLLVDDRYDSGWTMTVAARALRQAGVAEVLPLVLALEA